MKQKLVYYSICSVLFIHSVCMASVNIQDIQHNSSTPKFCRDLTEIPSAGTVCITGAGVKFMRTDFGWLDLGNSGRHWLDKRGTNVNYQQAENFCERNNARLPEGHEIMTAARHKIFDLFKDSQEGCGYRTQTKIQKNDTDELHEVFLYGQQAVIPLLDDTVNESLVVLCVIE